MSGRKPSSIQTEIWEGFLEEWGLRQPAAARTQYRVSCGSHSLALRVLSLCSRTLHGPEFGALKRGGLQ